MLFCVRDDLAAAQSRMTRSTQMSPPIAPSIDKSRVPFPRPHVNVTVG